MWSLQKHLIIWDIFVALHRSETNPHIYSILDIWAVNRRGVRLGSGLRSRASYTYLARKDTGVSCTQRSVLMNSADDVQNLFCILQNRQKLLAFQRRAFLFKYVDPNNDVGAAFLEYVLSCSTCYNDPFPHFLAPYVCVAQSYGYGKSPLVLESHRHIRRMSWVSRKD